jgi:hypothetical protein
VLKLSTSPSMLLSPKSRQGLLFRAHGRTANYLNAFEATPAARMGASRPHVAMRARLHRKGDTSTNRRKGAWAKGETDVT